MNISLRFDEEDQDNFKTDGLLVTDKSHLKLKL